ncbi:MAG: hypothetical protein ABF289_02270 [Clostridiales bacterium]
MFKKYIILFSLILSIVFLFGCAAKPRANDDDPSAENTKKNEDSNKDEATEDTEEGDDKSTDDSSEDSLSNFDNPLDPEKIVTAAFGKDDKLFDFKLDETKKFFKDFDKICSFLDERYTMEQIPTGFNKSKDKNTSQLTFKQDIEDYDNRFQSIMSVDYSQGFNDSKDKLYSYNVIYLDICDEDNDEKITLTDEMKGILKTFYEDIDLTETQKRIDESIQAAKNDSYESIELESLDKYHSSYFTSSKYEDDPIEVTINLDYYKDYPQ